MMLERPRSWWSPEWPVPARVRAVHTTREGPGGVVPTPYGFNVGSRCGDDPVAVARNRGSLREVLALPSAPCWLQQVHGTRVVALDAPLQCDDILPVRDRGAEQGSHPQEPQADAVVTRTPGVVLAIQTADCLPVLLAAADGSEVAAAHAGWRGLSAGVLEAVLAAMWTPRGSLRAWLGPAIGPRSYEVGAEVRDAFVARDPAAADAFTATRPGHWQCDLYALARQRLAAAGVEAVGGGGLDTGTDPCLHSFRRDGVFSGRMASLVWLAG